jgi:hypothetical protein
MLEPDLPPPSTSPDQPSGPEHEDSSLSRRALIAGAVAGVITVAAAGSYLFGREDETVASGDAPSGELDPSDTIAPTTLDGTTDTATTATTATTPTTQAQEPVMHAEDRSTEGPFAGFPVGDFPATAPGPGVAVRLNLGWDDDNTFEKLLSDLVAHPGAADLEALVVGAFDTDSLDVPGPAVQALIANAAKLPRLRALFFGDVSQERSEISWVETGDQAALAQAFPKLEIFRFRGSGHSTIAGFSSPVLHTLIIETGGLQPKVVRDVLEADLPALRHLELWLGTPEYGGETTLADLEPLLKGQVHTGLTYLGLRNSEIADLLAFAVSKSPIISTIEELDFSLGTIGDAGYLALAQMGPTPKLRTLNVSRHYAGPGAIEALTEEMTKRGVTVDTSDRQDEDDEDRWVSISE